MERKKALLVILIVLLPLFLLLFSYKSVVYVTEKTMLQQEVFDYLDGEQNLPNEFDVNERSHFEDVKRVMNFVEYVFYGLLLVISLCLTYVLKSRKFSVTERKRILQKVFLYSGIGTVGIVIVVLLGVLFDFSYVFTLFHKVFFPQGNWQFAVDSLIIQTFPVEFFISISRRIFVSALMWGIFFIGLGYYFKYDTSRNRN